VTQPLSPTLIEALDQRVLRYFLAVVRAGSIRGGADALHVTPSAVSRQIADLESTCGHVLLDRLTRGVAPTEAGRAVADFAQRQVEHAELLMDRLKEIDRVGRGTVTLWCGDGLIPDVLTNVLPLVLKNNPDVAVRLTSASTADILGAVVEGAADIGLAYHTPVRPDVQFFSSNRQPIIAMVPLAHRLATYQSLPLRDFASDPAVLLPRSHAVRQLLAGVEASEDFRLNAVFETVSHEAMRLFVENNLGIGFGPLYVCARGLEAGAFAGVTLSDDSLKHTEVQLFGKAGRRMPSAVNTVLQALTENLRAFSSA
jgi:DNA-binding transcriptional LysR family regulator